MSGAKIADVEVSAAALAGFVGAAALSSVATNSAHRLQAAADRKAAELAAADRHEAQVREVLTRNVRIQSLAAAIDRATAEHGLEVAQQLPAPFAIGDQRDLTSWIAATDAQLELVEKHLAAATAQSATGPLVAAGATDGLVTAVTRTTATDSDREQVITTVKRVLSRLAADATSAERAPVLAAVAELAAAPTTAEAESRLADVRVRVANANKQAAHRREQSMAASRQQLESEAVSTAVTATLSELGYSVSAGFETLTAASGEVYITRDGWTDHAVKMRIDAVGSTSQLRVAMVRTSQPESADDRRRDAEREDEWCESFVELRERLAAQGLQSKVTWALDHMQLPVVAQRKSTRDRSARNERTRERD